MDSLHDRRGNDNKYEESSKDQLQFLQDQVRRLTSVVREYQLKYMPIDENNIEEAPLAPWMTDMTMVSPLFVEYDNNIKSLKDQIKYYKEQFDNLQEKSREIVEENSKLHQELRRTVENQLESIQHSDGLSNHTQIHLDQLQNKLKVLVDEKNRVDTLYHEAIRDTKISHCDLKAKMQIIDSLTAENAQLQDDLNQARLYAEGLQKSSQRFKTEHAHFFKNSTVTGYRIG